MVRGQLSAIGSLLADETRAEFLTVLMDGRAHTGGELARHVGVSSSTASEHLARLLDAGLVAVEAQGRHRYFRLAGREVAAMLEALGATRLPQSNPSPRAPASLAFARCCYDHLAGEFAVRIYDQLLADGHVVEADHHLQLSSSGIELFGGLGVKFDAIRSSTRPRARSCLDWTERRHHLAGAAGAALFDALVSNRWVSRGPLPRSIRIDEKGLAAIANHFTLGPVDGTRPRSGAGP